jgi:hypothetical protein
MRGVPLLADHPRSVQVVLAIVAPIVFGAITGYFLGVSEPVYLVLSVIGILGGLGAGYDHVGARAGARRGAVAGSLFGASILVAHELHGEAAKVHLPDPAILLVAITTVLAVGLAALGGWLRERGLRRAEEGAPEVTGPPESEPRTAPPPTGGRTATSGGAISLTHGSFEEYRGLGMSVTQAKRVIAFRDRDGGYTSVEDLDRVPGFSRSFLVQLKRRLEA